MTRLSAADRSMADPDSPPLPFTGERFTPECVREIWHEHWHRYLFAWRIAHGKRVLDAACGEGYGSALLARAAADVLGLDIDAEAITHARERYATRANLRYETGDATLLDVAPASFDLIVSFETLEHVEAQERMLEGFARALADDGVLVISSPDKHAYSEVAGFRNAFHTRELYRDELLALLKPHFPAVRLYGQKLLFQSAIWPLDEAGGPCEAWTGSKDPGGPIAGKLDYAPLYFIAVCAKRELPQRLQALSLFGDREESVYAHYNHEVRKNMSAGERIAELERELHALRGTEPASSPDSEIPGPQERRDWRFWRRKPSE
jgi:SAM-dependent methyltransferase